MYIFIKQSYQIKCHINICDCLKSFLNEYFNVLAQGLMSYLFCFF